MYLGDQLLLHIDTERPVGDRATILPQYNETEKRANSLEMGSEEEK